MPSFITALVLFFGQAVKYGAPLLYGTVGEITNQKTGKMNLGVEGVMSIGALGGYVIGGSLNSPFMCVVMAFICGGLCGLLYCLLTVTFQANQNVTGLAITIFGVAFTDFVGITLVAKGSWPERTEKLRLAFSEGGIPLLRDIPIIGDIFFSSNMLVYLGILIAVGMWFFFNKTRQGLQVRAIGENPASADSVGVNIQKNTFLMNFIGCGIMGIGGLSVGVTLQTTFNAGWMLGYGWLSIALVIFANWSTLKAIGGSFVFGIFMVLQYNISLLADAMPLLLGWLKFLPIQLLQALPYLITALIIVISSMKKSSSLNTPKNLGVNYFREER